MILHLAVLIQYRRVTHTQTHRQTHDDGYYPCRASSTRVKITWQIILKHANILCKTGCPEQFIQTITRHTKLHG